MKDITKRFNIKDIDLLNRIVNYILTTPSQSFSAISMSKYFESKREFGVYNKINDNYPKYVLSTDRFAFHKTVLFIKI